MCISLRQLKSIPILLALIILTGCFSRTFETDICYTPKQRNINSLPSAFPSLTPAERKDEWGKELFIGNSLGKDFDLYRAITCYKRALILMPKMQQDRRLQAEYALLYSYYLGRRYCDVLETFESGLLRTVPDSFPAFCDLAVILYDSYDLTEQKEKACCIREMIANYDDQTAENLKLYSALRIGNLPCTIQTHPYSETLTPYINAYQCGKKSVGAAQFLNAVLPGAGYFYVGQRKSGITSFIMNALFIAATVQFAQKGFIPAAIITGSLEMGWYIGGINGAGLAANEYNARLYECQIKDMMIHHRLFPTLMLNTAF